MQSRNLIGDGARRRQWTGFVCSMLLACLIAPVMPADIVPGENVNMVAGPVRIDNDPFILIEGDPFLQRQNEPSCDVSTRNPLHLLCASNDYRTVDIAGLVEDNLVGDAWLGVYWSNNGGRTFRSSILPGFLGDTSPQSEGSPLKGFQAGADAVIRAGTHGMFYFAGIAFDRDVGGQTANAPVAGGGGNGIVFLARYLDLNNSPSDQKPIKPVGLPIKIAGGDPGRFLDKPWLVVDKPRGDADCSITVDGETQAIPSSKLYVAYAAFIDEPADPTDPNFDDGSSGDDDSSGDGSSYSDDSSDDSTEENQATEKYSELYVVPVHQCGSAPGTPVKVSGPKTDNRTNQGASLAIDPQTGAVVVVWRRFSHIGGQEDAILASTSTDGGKNWSPPATIKIVPEMLRPGDLSDVGGTFDQGSTARSARTNAFPTVAITDSGQTGVMGDIYVAWANRVEASEQSGLPRESRVVISKSDNSGVTWSEPFAIDEQALIGHQFQPTLHYQNGLLSIAYLDLRETHTRGVYSISVEPDAGDPGGRVVEIHEEREATGERESVASCELPDCYRLPDERLVWTDYMIDAAPENPDPDYQPVYSEHLKRRHTLDLRMLQFEPFDLVPDGGLGESVKVTSFPFGLRTRNGKQRLEQFQYLPPNFKMFAKGTKAFIGDYIHCGALNFVADQDGRWDFNTKSDIDPTLHCAWTDNRNVRPGPHASATSFSFASHSTEHYSPPGVGCDAGYAGTRNQDVFNSRITQGVYAGSFGNARPQGYVTIDSDPNEPGEQLQTILLQRAYDVFVENMTNQTRHYRLRIENQPGADPVTDRASFLQFPKAPFGNMTEALNNPPVDTLEVSIGPLSSAARAVFASAEAVHAPIRISVREIEQIGGSVLADGHATQVMLNPDSSNPAPRFPDSNIPPSVIYNPKVIEVLDIDVDSAVLNKVNFAPLRVAAPDPNNPDPTNPDPTNPDPTNPDPTNIVIEFPDPTNPDPTNPDPTNPDPTNPDPTNPDPTNPDPTNPDPTNPDPTNPDPTNATLYDVHANNPDIAETEITDNTSIRDTYWNLTNQGNVSTSYAVRLVSDATVPDNVSLQLLVHRTDVTPALTKADSCQLDMLRSAVTLINRPNPELVSADSLLNPDPSDPLPTNATFAVGPGENVILTLRVFDKDMSDGVTFEPRDQVVPAIIRPAGTYEWLNGRDYVIESQAPIFITAENLPLAEQGEPYLANIVVVGGTQPFDWSLTAGALPPDILMTTSDDGLAEISGTPTDAGDFNFTLSVTDDNGASSQQNFSLSISPAPPFSISTNALEHAVVGEEYQQVIESSGGKDQLNWSLIEGVLPDGLTLTQVGEIFQFGGSPDLQTPDTRMLEINVEETSGLQRQVTKVFELTVCVADPAAIDGLLCPTPTPSNP